ncbi:MAG: TolC family protein [Planctomycetota bacterium]|nr:TolC family protein [Planctomycetota bacterium]
MERFNATISSRILDLQLDPQRPLALQECEQIALRNNLAYRVKLLETRLQDDEVRLAFSRALPEVTAEFKKTRRSNEPLVSGQSGGTFSFEDIEVDRFNIRALIPIFDFGSTYFAYQMAKDRRVQERLAAVRARQLLLRDVRVSYARFASAIRQERLARAAVEAAKDALNVSRSLEREGLAARSDTAFVEAGLAQADLEWTMAKRLMLETRSRLSNTMSVTTWTEYMVQDSSASSPPMPTLEKVKELEQIALRLRPELWSQDLERHIAANNVRRSVAAFFPHIGGNADFDWTSISTQVNPAYFTFGFTVGQTLLDGTSRIWQHKLAKGQEATASERALLTAMGVLFEVDFRILQLIRAHDTLDARRRVVTSQESLLKLIQSRHRENLESGANVARALADLREAQRSLDQSETDYLVAWYELNAAALADEQKDPEAQAEALPPVENEPADKTTPGKPSLQKRRLDKEEEE